MASSRIIFLATVALILACHVAPLDARMERREMLYRGQPACPTECEVSLGSWGSLPLYSIPFISGYIKKGVQIANATECEKFCDGAKSGRRVATYYEFCEAGNQGSLFGFQRRVAGDCVCYQKCLQRFVLPTGPNVKMTGGVMAECT